MSLVESLTTVGIQALIAAEFENHAIFYPEAFGALGDGVTDDTAAILAADAALSFYGGTLVFDRSKTYRLLGCLAPVYTGPSGAPIQTPRRWTSNGGATQNGYWAASPINSGAILDLRYAGSGGLHPAKIDTRGAGFLEIDHLTFKSGEYQL